MSRGPKAHRPGDLVKVRETGEFGVLGRYYLHPTDCQSTGDWCFDFQPCDGGPVRMYRTIEITRKVNLLQALGEQAE